MRNMIWYQIISVGSLYVIVFNFVWKQEVSHDAFYSSDAENGCVEAVFRHTNVF